MHITTHPAFNIDHINSQIFFFIDRRLFLVLKMDHQQF